MTNYKKVCVCYGQWDYPEVWQVSVHQEKQNVKFDSSSLMIKTDSRMVLSTTDFRLEKPPKSAWVPEILLPESKVHNFQKDELILTADMRG